MYQLPILQPEKMPLTIALSCLISSVCTTKVRSPLMRFAATSFLFDYAKSAKTFIKALLGLTFKAFY